MTLIGTCKPYIIILLKLNTCRNSDRVFILGYNYVTKKSFYEKPIHTTKLDIFEVNNLDYKLGSWAIDYIKCRCMVLPVFDNCNNISIAYPLLHTYRTQNRYNCLKKS